MQNFQQTYGRNTCEDSVNQYVVDVNALQNNIRIVRTLAGQVPVWAVLKGDGYGLGLLNMAYIMNSEGIDRFCITQLKEAKMLAEAGLGQGKTLMLQPTRDADILRELIRLNVICTVSSAADASVIDKIAKSENRTAQVHIKIDTGMGRFGFQTDAVDEILSVYRMEHLLVAGIYTHFACSSSKKKTWRQYKKFQRVIRKISDAGYLPGECHCCSSGAFLRWPEMYMDGVRIGSAWLGRKPIEQKLGLQKIGYCQSRIEQLHKVPKGQTSGYRGAWRAKRISNLAIVPVGWYHGFGVEYNRDVFGLRECLRGCLSWIKAFLTGKRLWVRINGTKCPVCGHIGMLYIAADVTDIPCVVGDTVRMELSPLLRKNMEIQYLFISHGCNRM